jgi:hypothetical protein
VEQNVEQDKVANSLWIGDNLSPQHVMSINSFLQNGFKYNLYTYDEVKNIPSGVNVLDGNVILPESRIWVYKKGFNKGGLSGYSCEFRYQFLYNNGGLFVDTDIVLLKPLNLNKKYIFISELNEDGDTITTNSLIYSQSTTASIWSEALDDISYRNKARLRHGEVGPILLNNIVNKHKLEKYVLQPNLFCSIAWYETIKLLDGTQLPNDAIGIHLCDAINDLDNIDIKTYPYVSIIEQLKRKYL